MSDIFNDIMGEDAKGRPSCRVAYTLNNTQPVVCTIIGDQPLFYIDYEGGYDEEEECFFDASDSRILDNEINSLYRELDRYEDFQHGQTFCSAKKLEDFLEGALDITEQQNSADVDIAALKEILSESRLAASYLKYADEYDVELAYSEQIETAVYDRNCGKIFINPRIEKIDQVFLATQELRRHWQHRQGALIHPLMFHPDNSVLVNRVQVADLVTSVIRVAWELQLSGNKDAWERIENSTLADLGRAFAREAYLDFRTINNGQAAAAVFEAWFLSERCRAQDKILINQMLADHQGYVFDLEMSEKTITPNLIAALGAMPFGKNYLAEHAHTIMEDPIFTDVRDRSSANFLWFVKFERSFRETEQELQHSDHPSFSEAAGEFPSSGSHTQDAFDGQVQSERGESAQIISLYGDEKSGDKSAKNKRGSGKGSRFSPDRHKKDDDSNVVYIRRWSGE